MALSITSTSFAAAMVHWHYFNCEIYLYLTDKGRSFWKAVRFSQKRSFFLDKVLKVRYRVGRGSRFLLALCSFSFVMEHSRRWQLHIGGSKMFELLFHAGMSVLDHFFLRISKSMSTDWIRVRSRKITHRSGKPAKKCHFLKSFFGWASTKLRIPGMGQPKSGIPEMGQPILGIPGMGQPKSGIPKMG